MNKGALKPEKRAVSVLPSLNTTDALAISAVRFGVPADVNSVNKRCTFCVIKVDLARGKGVLDAKICGAWGRQWFIGPDFHVFILF